MEILLCRLRNIHPILEKLQTAQTIEKLSALFFFTTLFSNICYQILRQFGKQCRLFYCNSSWCPRKPIKIQYFFVSKRNLTALLYFIRGPPSEI